jgi:hypothetical protein
MYDDTAKEIIGRITDSEIDQAIENGFGLWIKHEWNFPDSRDDSYPRYARLSEEEVRIGLGIPGGTALRQAVKDLVIAPWLKGYGLDWFGDMYDWLDWDCSDEMTETVSDGEYESFLRGTTLMYALRNYSAFSAVAIYRTLREMVRDCRFNGRPEQADFWERANKRRLEHNARDYVPEAFAGLPPLVVDGKQPVFETAFNIQE